VWVGGWVGVWVGVCGDFQKSKLRYCIVRIV